MYRRCPFASTSWSWGDGSKLNEWIQSGLDDAAYDLADFERSRTNLTKRSETWITGHACAYDIEKRMFRMIVQEDYEHTFDFWLDPSARPSVTPGVSQLFDTAEEATNLVKFAALVPSAEVAAVLTTDEVRNRYVGSFDLVVVPADGGRFAVEAALIMEAQSNLVENAAELTRQLALTNVLALVGEATTNLTLGGGVSGFYYSLYDSAAVTELAADANEENLNVLCGADGKIVFPAVKKPSEAQGFFSVGAEATPRVR